MAKDSKKAKLSAMLKELLNKPVSIANMSPEEIASLAEGYHTFNNGEALAAKIMQLATMGREWAVQVVLERTEGRAVQGAKEDGTDRSTEEKLDDITMKHLNAIAKRSAVVQEVKHVADEHGDAAGDVLAEAQSASVPQSGAARPTTPVVALPPNGIKRPQGPQR